MGGILKRGTGNRGSERTRRSRAPTRAERVGDGGGTQPSLGYLRELGCLSRLEKVHPIWNAQPSVNRGHRIANHRAEGSKVILASKLAHLYGVSTKRLNEQVKRNPDRFPDDFAFRLTRAEQADLRSQTATSNGRGGERYLTWAFTEHGAIQAANVLNSEVAIEMGIMVVRAFVAMSGLKLSLPDIAGGLNDAHARLDKHDQIIDVVVNTLKSMGDADQKRRKRKIGFR